MVIDQRVLMSEEERNADVGDLHLVFDLDRLAETQTPLLVLTGHLHGPGSAMTFDDIEPMPKLAIDRSDVPSNSSIDVALFCFRNT